MNQRIERGPLLLGWVRFLAVTVPAALALRACNTCHTREKEREPNQSSSPGTAHDSADAAVVADGVAALPPQAPGQPTPPLRLGDTAALRDFTITVVETRACEVPRYFKARPGYVKLGVLVEIRGSSKQEVPVNVFYAKLTPLVDGKEYLPVLGGCTPELRSSHVMENQVARGWITFEVPEATGASNFTYRPFIISSPAPQEASFRVQR